MPKTFWTQENKELLSHLYDITPIAGLALRFGLPRNNIKSIVQRMGLRRHCKDNDYVRFPGARRPCEVMLIRAFYQDLPAYKIIDFLPGRDAQFVARILFDNGLTRSKDEKLSIAREFNMGKWGKGHLSWNKGMIGFKPGGRAAETQFKKGHLPHTTLPDFAESIVPDYSGRPIRKIKIPGRGMEFLARWNWEQAHGPIPKGMLICHLDRDPLNCDISNLVMRTRSENASVGSANNNPEYRVTKRRISIISKRIEDGRAMVGDEELLRTLLEWVQKYEADNHREQKKVVRKAKKQLKVAVEKEVRKQSKPMAVKKLPATKREDYTQRRELERKRKMERREETKLISAAKRKLAKQKEREQAWRVIEEGKRTVDLSAGKRLKATAQKWEINRRTVILVQPHKVDEFLKKYPHARQLQGVE